MSGRAYFSLNFLPPLSLLDPYSDYVWVNISLNNSSSLPHLNVYAPPICSSSTNGRTNSFSPSILLSSRNLFILGNLNCHHPFWDSRGTSDLLPLNDSDIPTLFHCFSGSHSSPDISFAIFSLAQSCSCEVLQYLGSDHLPIFLTVSLFLVFCPNKHPPSFNFLKARWDDFASHFDSHCPFAKEYLSLSSAAALFTSLALIAAKSSFLLTASNTILKPGGLLKWKKWLVKDARLLLPLTEVMKIARLISLLPSCLISHCQG